MLKKLLLTTLLLVAALNSYATLSKETLDERLTRSAESFKNVIAKKEGEIPHQLLADAKGVLILREYGAGLGIGGKGGFGVVMKRQWNGQWGPPAFISRGEGSWGIQIGVQRLDMVFLFMTDDALKIFEHEKFKIGVDAAAAAGPVGADAQAKTGSPVLVYSDAKGLYAGASFEGGWLNPDKDANYFFYKKDGITVPEILDGKVWFPKSAELLRHTLEDYQSGKLK